jgi:hypothetical protein
MFRRRFFHASMLIMAAAALLLAAGPAGAQHRGYCGAYHPGVYPHAGYAGYHGHYLPHYGVYHYAPGYYPRYVAPYCGGCRSGLYPGRAGPRSQSR